MFPTFRGLHIKIYEQQDQMKQVQHEQVLMH